MIFGRFLGTGVVRYVGALVGGMAITSPTAAGTSDQEPPIPIVVLSLADSETHERWYSLVPSDSPILLPIRQDSSTGLAYPLDGVRLGAAPLTVDGDPNGAVSSAGVHNGRLEWTWTPAARELDRTYTAQLASSAAQEGAPTSSPVVASYEASNFEFSYTAATSAAFLSTVELTVTDFPPSYRFVGATCCEVVASQCAGTPGCFQCWELEGKFWVGGVWDGPGLPYLSLSLQPDLDNLEPGMAASQFQVKERREYCLEGTATASGESTTLTACGTPNELPMHEASGLRPVFADSCKTLPANAYPMTPLVAVRAATEADALELLAQQSAGPAPTSSPETSPDHALLPACTAAPKAPARPDALLGLGALIVVSAAIRRRRKHIARGGSDSEGT